MKKTNLMILMFSHLFITFICLAETGVEKQISTTNGPVSFATVGSDNNCDFRTGSNKIQRALDDDSNFDEIRIADNQTYVENVNIIDRSVTLRGGFANCSDANANIQDENRFTTISGDLGPGATIYIGSNLADTYNVFLDNLELKDGSGLDGELDAGGLSAVNTNVRLFLNRMRINNNRSGIAGGGGINIFNANGTRSELTASNTKIRNNNGSLGGGLHCNGANNQVNIFGASSLSANTAMNGGGAYITEGCKFTLVANGLPGGAGDVFDGITLNQANTDGGGIYVDEGGQAIFYGNPYDYDGSQICADDPGSCSSYVTPVVNISLNTAGNFGGGVFVKDPGSSVTVNTGQINLNEADGSGGGVYVNRDADFTMRWHTGQPDLLFPNCRDSQNKCSQLSGNSANLGGGIYVSAGGQASVLRTHAANNTGRLNNAFGAMAYVIGLNSTLDLDSSIITGNGDANDQFVFRLFDGESGTIALTTRNTTIADNQAVAQIFGINNSAMNISASIISEPDATGILEETISSGNATFNCTVVNENSTLQNSNLINVVVDDPAFIDRNNGDYHINAASSQAVDLCASNDSSVNLDIDLENRGFDDPDANNVKGFYDAGADETYDSDIIFKDGFE